MAENSKIVLKSENDLKLFLHQNYMNQIKNFFGDEKKALKFLSSVMAAVQKTPKLLECEPMTLINSFMTMAQLGLMPSDVSGEAYVLPYAKNTKVGDKWEKKIEAQFQLGYQGIVTLFYRAGGVGIRSDIIRKNDKFSYKNGHIEHEIDILKSNKERGIAVGAYAIASVNGEQIAKAMNQEDIVGIGKNFSKSFDSEYTPWKEKNDPELWMWKKTVLKQLAKMLPKNETINKAIALDNTDSIIQERVEKALKESEPIKMGNLLENDANSKNKKDKAEAKPPTDNNEGQEAGN